MVECNLAKVEVAGSNPVSRSLSIYESTPDWDAAEATVRTFVLTFLECAGSATIVRELLHLI